MLHDGWTLLDQPSCEGCNATLMKYNDSNADNNNIYAATSSSSAEVIKGQCVNVECPLSYTAEDNIDKSDGDGSTKVQSWDTSCNKENGCTSYDEDDSYFFEEDDPAIIQMQLIEMRKRDLIINNNINVDKVDAQCGNTNNSDEIETTVSHHEDNNCQEEDNVNDNTIPAPDEINNDGELTNAMEDTNEEEVKMKSYINAFDTNRRHSAR